uniref:Uncharacterized protein n=1 Tax=viral metagenome TaxID=1070528 RepID=A0A6C0HS28_9ZZZZ
MIFQKNPFFDKNIFILFFKQEKGVKNKVVIEFIIR